MSRPSLAGMGDADDVLARLRLRARLTEAEAEATAGGAAAVVGGGDARAGLPRARHRRERLPRGGPAARLAQRLRWRVSWRAVVGCGVVLVAVLLVAVIPKVAAGWVRGSDSSGELVFGSATALAADGASGTGTDNDQKGNAGSDQAVGSGEPSQEVAAQPVWVVYVAGAVAQPGVVELAPGSRVVDAVDAVGGALAAADLSGLNLAAPVVDGQMIYVPLPGETPPAGAGGGAAPGETSAGSGAALVNVNTANADELTALPGIGPVLAGRLVAYREA
ncbi:MAG: ComEA family DNA-binding protein, partial [Bifidobacteriaceae bacterium]|nr:ComEA family DNA-binding protein [Bifidobacteriaceae bacterium]